MTLETETNSPAINANRITPADPVKKVVDILARILYAHEMPEGASIGNAKLCPMFAEMAREALKEYRAASPVKLGNLVWENRNEPE